MSDELLLVRCKREPNSLSAFSGFFIGQPTGQRSCTIPSVWWTPTFSIIARRSPGVSWVFICSRSSIISTGKSKFTIFSAFSDAFRICVDVWTSAHFFIYCLGLFRAEVWSMPWWASNRQEIWRNKRHRVTNGDINTILPITGLGFQPSNFGQNKTNLSDNVNVKVLYMVSLYPRYCCRTAGHIFERLKSNRGRSRCLCCLWPVMRNNNIFLKGLEFSPCCSYWSSRSTHCESPNTLGAGQQK